MKCSKCGAEITNLNHYFIPIKNSKDGLRLCFKCAREDNYITLV